MVIASHLRPGTILNISGDLLKVIESTFHVGQGKMPGSVHAKLRDVRKGTFKELRWRPEEKLEEAELSKVDMDFLYSDSDSATFMKPVTFDQVSIPLEAIGNAADFLKPDMRVAVEFYEGRPVSIDFPEIVEVEVETTSAPVHTGQDNTLKPATIANGLEVMVPQFIKQGEIVRIDVATRKYVDRVRTAAKRL
jgi:elongation factor P